MYYGFEWGSPRIDHNLDLAVRPNEQAVPV